MLFNEKQYLYPRDDTLNETLILWSRQARESLSGEKTSFWCNAAECVKDILACTVYCPYGTESISCNYVPAALQDIVPLLTDLWHQTKNTIEKGQDTMKKIVLKKKLIAPDKDKALMTKTVETDKAKLDNNSYQALVTGIRDLLESSQKTMKQDLASLLQNSVKTINVLGEVTKAIALQNVALNEVLQLVRSLSHEGNKQGKDKDKESSSGKTGAPAKGVMTVAAALSQIAEENEISSFDGYELSEVYAAVREKTEYNHQTTYIRNTMIAMELLSE